LIRLGLRQERGEDHFACCGRPLISNGMIDEAGGAALHNVKSLYPLAVEGYAITACEPSCVLTIKDDYPALLRGEYRRQADVVAAACRTFEEFMESALASRVASAPREQNACKDAALGALTQPRSPGSLTFRPGPKKILVQGHCHQ